MNKIATVKGRKEGENKTEEQNMPKEQTNALGNKLNSLE